MTDLPDVKLRALPNFPVAVTGRTAIAIEKTSGRYYLDLDVSDLVQNVNISADEVDQSWMLIWNSTTDAYELVPYALAATSGVSSLDGKTGALDIGDGLAFTGDTLEAIAKDFASRAAVTVATVNSTVTYLRTAGYTAAGDGGGGLYKKVVAEPSHYGKVQSGDGTWWELVISGLQDVRKFGVFPGVDATTRLNEAISTTSVFFPPASSSYMTGDVAIPSNRHIWVQKGATILNTGGRFTGYVPGGGNIHFQIDGVINFASTTTKPALAGWPANNAGLWPERGLIEMGGANSNGGSNFKVTGTGKVSGDYNYTGIVVIDSANYPVQLNMKGIAFFNCSDVLCEGMEVTKVYGECIYYYSELGSRNVKFLNNYVHHVGFNGLNFNTLVAHEGMIIAHNTVGDCVQGIEISSGVCHGNYIDTCLNGIITGGGGGQPFLRVTDNTVTGSTNIGYSVEFDPGAAPQQIIIIEGNIANFAGITAFELSSIDGFQLKNNIAYAHASRSAGYAYSIAATATSGHIDGNLTRSPGAFSAGNLINGAGAANTVGTNPVFP